MFGPVAGNFLNSRREFLYEKCTLHITEKIPSSVKFGSRPRIFLMRANSSVVKPCCATTSGVISGSAVGIGSTKISETAPALKSRVSSIELSGVCDRGPFTELALHRNALQPVAGVPGLRQEPPVQVVTHIIRIRPRGIRQTYKAVNS